jgi:hypothetical protein
MSIMTTEQLVKAERIPEWLGNALPNECQCGCPILNNEDLTFRWCMNPTCYYHMQHKGDEMFKHLNVKGIGPATCLAGLRRFKLKNHFELLPRILGEVKPRVHLWEIADMAGIYGYGKVFWEKALAGKKTFEEYFDSGNFIPKDIVANKKLLIDAEEYFSIKPALSNRYISVMMTGSITGFNNRDQFIEKCNEIGGQYLRVRDTGKNGSVDYLITEDVYSNTGKAKLARQNGISIVTPKEFIALLTALITELLEEEK